MARPEFTNDEQYLIASARSPSYSHFGSAHTWGYLIPGFILFGFGIYRNAFDALIASFIVLAVFRLREMWYEYRWSPIWTSVVQKYEDAIADKSTAP